MRRDVLQLGVDQDPAPRLFPQPLHLRPPGHLHRAHRRRAAVVQVVLPAAAGPARRAGRHRARPPVRAPLRRLPARSAQPARRIPAALSAAVRARAQSPDPGALVAVLPQSDRVRRRPHRQRHQHLPVRRAGEARRRRQALPRRPADRRRRSRFPVLGQPRLFPGRHGGAVRVRRVPPCGAAGQDRRRALHDGRAAEGRQEPVLPRFPAPPQAFARQVHHRPRHQGPGDERVHAAVVPVCVQGDQGQDRRVEGHHPRSRSRASTRWSSTTIAWAG